MTLPTPWALPVSTAFDNNGSMTELPLSDTSKYLLKFDAWNRLVKVEFDSVPSGTPTTVAEYEYNAVGWRTRKIVSSPSSQSRVFYYGANWQMLEEHIDDGYSSGTGHVTDRVAQQLWGIRSLNDAVSRRIDNNSDLDGPADWEGEWFYLGDGRQNTVALVAPNGQIGERVSYDAYGQAMHRRPSDLRGDGVYDATYVTTRLSGAGCATISAAGYDADLDFNRDGTACGTSGNPDLTLTNDWLTAGTATAVPAGQISETIDAAVAPCAQIAPDSPLGYASHYFDPETGFYLMRHRAYSTELGRFVQVDPIGYDDGMNVYQYTGSSPIGASDPMGLCTRSNMPEAYQNYLSAGLSHEMAVHLMEHAVSQAQDAENEARWQLELENSVLYRFQGGMDRTLNALSFGYTDEAGLTNSQRYQGGGYETSEYIATGARELAIAVGSMGLGQAVQAGRGGLLARSFLGAERAYDRYETVQSGINAVGSLASGNYGAAALNGLGAIGGARPHRVNTVGGSWLNRPASTSRAQSLAHKLSQEGSVSFSRADKLTLEEIGSISGQLNREIAITRVGQTRTMTLLGRSGGDIPNGKLILHTHPSSGQRWGGLKHEHISENDYNVMSAQRNAGMTGRSAIVNDFGWWRTFGVTKGINPRESFVGPLHKTP